jgi:hypothetical protein
MAGRKPLPRIPLNPDFVEAVRRSPLTRTAQARRAGWPQANYLGSILISGVISENPVFMRRLERLAALVGYVGPILEAGREKAA